MTSQAESAEQASQDGPTADEPSRGTPPRVVTRFDLRCLLCARVLGSVEADGRRPAGSVLFRAEGGEHVVQVNDWRRLRCCSCGGNCYPDEVQTARVYPTVGWDDDDRPRRGRPPKWLVDARKARATTRE